MVFGVSPAWFLSLYGEHFTVAQCAESLEILRELNLSSWQPEIFVEEALEEWTGGASEDLRKKSDDLGLVSRTFVAHFLGAHFSDERGLERKRDLDLLDRVLEGLTNWEGIEVISALLPPFAFEGAADADPSRRWMEFLEMKLRSYAERIEASGRILALEAMPGNVAGGSAGIAALLDREGLGRVGINYDTGHFHAAGESQSLVLARLGGRIACTHLCDNDGVKNLSLAPGDGTISWEPVVRGLRSMAYDGPWDLEIRCPADAVKTAYSRGRELLERLMLKESA